MLIFENDIFDLRGMTWDRSSSSKAQELQNKKKSVVLVHMNCTYYNGGCERKRRFFRW